MDEGLYKSTLERMRKLREHAQKISAEKSPEKLPELILFAIKDITNSDGGTLYLPTEKGLKFEIVVNSKLNIYMGGSSNVRIGFPPIPYTLEDGEPNHKNIASSSFNKKQIVCLDDAYDDSTFDLTGIWAFDTKMNYRTKGILTIPLYNHEEAVLGVIQMINPLDDDSTARSFNDIDVEYASFLASSAAMALSNTKLIGQMDNLFKSLARSIATAIDNKSPYTGKHCDRVPEIAMMITQVAMQSEAEPFKDFNLNEEELQEMELAALLHDCGKVSTPVHVIDKATKLETIFDRIELVASRFEVLKRDKEIDFLKFKLELVENGKADEVLLHEQRVKAELEQLDDDIAFIRKCNVGAEFMEKEDQLRVEKVSQYQKRNSLGFYEDILTADEVMNLNISRGTLNEEERKIINDHIVITLKMLNELDYPKHLKNIPDIAGSHHERMDGKGYPRGLKGEEISVQAKIIGIADIFEALTAMDRPYKKGKTLSESIKILGFMKKEGHIDSELFHLFIEEKIYMIYASKYLAPYQIDEVDHNNIPGFTPSKPAAIEEAELPAEKKQKKAS
jgi:HD-GYP domain-containing protein (c-di-GMP phosphodiesterase class II)